MKKYLPRVYDNILERRLESKGAVLVEGPKWCGKTTTAEQVAKSVVYMQDPKSREQNLRLAQLAPDRLLKGEVLHYRDKSGLECDAVVRLRNGRYGLVEIKLGGDKLVSEGAANLIKLAKKIDTGEMRPPSFLMVLTGTGEFSYPREDGVLVVPVRTLGA